MCEEFLLKNNIFSKAVYCLFNMRLRAMHLKLNKRLANLRDFTRSEEEVIVRKRGWEGITIDILEATLKPEKKMRIMYKANLNFARFNAYFQEFLSKGLVEAHNGSDGKAVYMISPRGKTLLDALRKARDIFASSEA